MVSIVTNLVALLFEVSSAKTKNLTGVACNFGVIFPIFGDMLDGSSGRISILCCLVGGKKVVG